MSKTEFQQTATNASIIGFTAFGGAILGFVLQLAVAYYFGAGQATDAYFMAQSSSELLGKILLGGSIIAVFIPLFVEQLNKQGKEIAWKNALNIMHTAAAAYVLLLAIVAFATEPFVNFIAPGFDQASTLLTANLLKVLLPSFFFLFLMELGTAMLQSVKHFTTPALLRMVAPAVSLGSVIILVDSVGIYSLAIGALAGSCIQISLIIWALHKQGFSYSFVLQPTSPTIKKLIRLTYPFFFSMVSTLLAGIVYRILVSHLASGSLSYLKNAEKITQMINVIFLTSVVSAMYPTLADKSSKGDTEGLKQSLASATRIIFFVSVPIFVGLILLRNPLVSFIYQHGSFTAESAAQTSLALLFLSVGLTTNGISAIYGNATVAIQKTKAAVTITIASQIVAIALFYILTPRMGHTGLALASGLVPIASGLMYIIFLGKHIPSIWTIFAHQTYLKTIALSIVMFGIVSMVIPITNTIVAPKILADTLKVFIPIIIGSTVYIAGAYSIHVSEIRQVSDILKRRLKKFI